MHPPLYARSPAASVREKASARRMWSPAVVGVNGELENVQAFALQFKYTSCRAPLGVCFLCLLVFSWQPRGCFGRLPGKTPDSQNGTRQVRCGLSFHHLNSTWRARHKPRIRKKRFQKQPLAPRNERSVRGGFKPKHTKKKKKKKHKMVALRFFPCGSLHRLARPRIPR